MVSNLAKNIAIAIIVAGLQMRNHIRFTIRICKCLSTAAILVRAVGGITAANFIKLKRFQHKKRRRFLGVA